MTNPTEGPVVVAGKCRTHTAGAPLPIPYTVAGQPDTPVAVRG